MDNFGRDVERGMWLLLIGGVLAGASAATAVIYIVQKWVRA